MYSPLSSYLPPLGTKISQRFPYSIIHGTPGTGHVSFNSQSCSLKLLSGAREIAQWLTMLIMTAVGPKFNPSPPCTELIV